MVVFRNAAAQLRRAAVLSRTIILRNYRSLVLSHDSFLFYILRHPENHTGKGRRLTCISLTSMAVTKDVVPYGPLRNHRGEGERVLRSWMVVSSPVFDEAARLHSEYVVLAILFCCCCYYRTPSLPVELSVAKVNKRKVLFVCAAYAPFTCGRRVILGAENHSRRQWRPSRVAGCISGRDVSSRRSPT